MAKSPIAWVAKKASDGTGGVIMVDHQFHLIAAYLAGKALSLTKSRKLLDRHAVELFEHPLSTIPHLLVAIPAHVLVIVLAPLFRSFASLHALTTSPVGRISQWRMVIAADLVRQIPLL